MGICLGKIWQVLGIFVAGPLVSLWQGEKDRIWKGYRKGKSRGFKLLFEAQIKFWRNRIIFDRTFWDKIRKEFFWRSSSQNLWFHAHFQMSLFSSLSSGHQVHILSSCHPTKGYLVSFISLAERVKEDLKVWRKMTFQGIRSLCPATCFCLTNLWWLRHMVLGLQTVHWLSDPSACINSSDSSWDKKIDQTQRLLYLPW